MERDSLKYVTRVGDDEHPYCIDDFIKYLNTFDEERRKLPLVCFTQNGSFTEPCIKMVKPSDDFFGEPIALAITTTF